MSWNAEVLILLDFGSYREKWVSVGLDKVFMPSQYPALLHVISVIYDFQTCKIKVEVEIWICKIYPAQKNNYGVAWLSRDPQKPNLFAKVEIWSVNTEITLQCQSRFPSVPRKAGKYVNRGQKMKVLPLIDSNSEKFYTFCLRYIFQ